jgi:pantoate--beta-alanine ligase
MSTPSRDEHPAVAPAPTGTGTGRPRVVTSPAQLRAARAELDGTVALVPTMGALHEGHLHLVRRARASADHVILSDFVNPLQFGPDEDYEAYPRDLEADLDVVGDLVDLVFAPSAEDMYPRGRPAVSVSAGHLGTVLEGARRPGHYDGVVTVVTKLLLLARPDLAVFGRKDAQQLAIVQNLVADLDIDVRIEPVPIVREENGLARSSRNAYLDATSRERALVLSRTVAAADRAAPSAEGVRRVLEDALTAPAEGVEWDYALAVDPTTFDPITSAFRGTALVVLAARVGGTRLLDATVVEVTAS